LTVFSKFDRDHIEFLSKRRFIILNAANYPRAWGTPAQLEARLLFKLWKSHSGLGQSHSEKAERMLCEIYAKLLGVLVQHWIVLTGLWRMPNRSLVKGCQMIKEQSACLASCIYNFDSLVSVLKDLAERFEYGCKLNTRKTNPNTCQRLEIGEVFS
jgi:hypothetical protein